MAPTQRIRTCRQLKLDDGERASEEQKKPESAYLRGGVACDPRAVRARGGHIRLTIGIT